METTADAFGQVITQQSSSGSATSTYSYDALGRALQTGFAYTGLGNSLAGDGTSTYVRDPFDDLVGVAAGATKRAVWTDIHTDVVGQFTPTSTGLDGSSTYDPYGKVLSATGMVGNLGYQSEFTDFTTGRVNMHARWYNPETGQFDTRDSVDVAATPESVRANRYAYGDANPLVNTDPTGHMTIKDDVTGGGCGAECQLQGYYEDYNGALNDMYKANRDSQKSLWDVLIEVGVGMLLDFIGYNDAVSCFGKGDIGACVELFMGALPSGKIFKLGKSLFKMVENAISGYRTWKRVINAGKALYKRAQSVLDYSRKKIDQLSKQIAKKPKALKKPPAKKTYNPTKTWKTKKTAKNKKPTEPKKPDNPKSKANKDKDGKDADQQRKRDQDRERAEANDPEAPSCSIPAGRKGLGAAGEVAAEVGAVALESHSFDPSTPVLMADGSTKPISEVAIGDKVAATDPETGETTSQPVTTLHLNRDTELTEVTVSSTPASDAKHRAVGEGKGDRSTRGPTTTVLQTTTNHPFWDNSKRAWVDAGELTPGVSTLVGPDGQLQHVTKVHSYTSTKNMRDLTVATIHTYYVLAGTTPVLVHNCTVDYGSTDLSVEVLKERLRIGSDKNNGAAARYIDASGNVKIAVTFSGGGKGRDFHAERKLIDQLGKDNILEIYSELQPCSGKGANCSVALQGIKQTWSWPWTTSAVGTASRKSQGDAIRKMFEEAAAGIW